MKSESEINNARRELAKRLQTRGLTGVQNAVLSGMLNALVWVADGRDSSTVQRLLDGEAIDAGKDTRAAERRFENNKSAFSCPKCGQPMAHSRLRGIFCPICRP